MAHAERQVEAWVGGREATPAEVREALERLHGREVEDGEIEYQDGGTVLLVSLPNHIAEVLMEEGFVEESVVLADGTRVTIEAEADR
ncbi:MAG: hypothetical protein M3R38_34855 [Actinomycetota bacterium]|nr:hypothetical protein [Actinomycetota bacterium]